jgi:hypothetical protein
MSARPGRNVAASHAAWIALIRSEYREMPDLRLTPRQMQRMWGLDAETCAAVLERLTAEKALRLTASGAYAAVRGRSATPADRNRH